MTLQANLLYFFIHLRNFPVSNQVSTGHTVWMSERSVKHGGYQTMASAADYLKSAMCRRWQGTLPLPCANTVCLEPQGKLIFANMMRVECVSYGLSYSAGDCFESQPAYRLPQRSFSVTSTFTAGKCRNSGLFLTGLRWLPSIHLSGHYSLFTLPFKATDSAFKNDHK